MSGGHGAQPSGTRTVVMKQTDEPRDGGENGRDGVPDLTLPEVLGVGAVLSESGLIVQDDPADRLPRGIRVAGRAMSVLAGCALVVLMLMTVADVLRRQIWERGIPYVIETTELVLVAVVFASLMSAEISKAHVRTSILTSRLPARAGRVVRLIGMVVATGVAAWFAFATWRTGLESFEIREYRPGLGRVPIWPAKLMIPVGLSGMAVVCGARCFLLAQGLRPRHPSTPEETAHE